MTLLGQVDFVFVLPAVENEFSHPHREKHVRGPVVFAGSLFLPPVALLNDGPLNEPRKTTNPAGQRTAEGDVPGKGFKKLAQGHSAAGGRHPG